LQVEGTVHVIYAGDIAQSSELVTGSPTLVGGRAQHCHDASVAQDPNLFAPLYASEIGWKPGPEFGNVDIGHHTHLLYIINVHYGLYIVNTIFELTM
jgi:hypothetical protein